MRVRDVMTRNPGTIRPSTSISEARRLMQRHGVRHLPVTDGDTLVGIVSDRDIVVRDPLLDAALDKLGAETYWGHQRRIDEIMTRDVVTVAPDEPVFRASVLMRQRKVSALPVVSEGRLVGIVTTHDLLAAVPERGAEEENAMPAVTRLVPMGPGDERPGRAPAPPRALVIDADGRRRLATAERLEDECYDVITCPGPAPGTMCEVCHRIAGVRCARVDRDVTLILVQADRAGAELLEAYRAWAPAARLEVSGERPAAEG
jgi:CBS domain-containing protein